MKTDVRSQILPAEAASAQAGTENGLISYLVISLFGYLGEQGELVI
jgi:hypothetical protein